MSLEQVPNGKTAVVTGAARGIGRALVDNLYARGYTVVAVVRNLADVEQLAALAPGKILPIRCDVTEQSTEKVLREFLDAKCTSVDLLINNAGHGATKCGIAAMDFNELNRVMAVSCHGPARVVRACLPHLRKAGNSAILNISSRFGSMEWVATGAVPHEEATYPYRIAKAAMNMFTSCLAVELKDEGIRVLAVDPGKVRTRCGPKDADTEPQDAARSIVDLAENTSETGLFVHASGERVPW
jgi:NAD(P)-dependent dehydrogenase (short-subunit alcohol dehydrogenase family)